MPKFKIALNTSAGELDSKVIEIAEEDENGAGQASQITYELIKWLEDGLLVDEGDSIAITELS